MKSLLAAVMFSAILNACSSSTAPSKSADGSGEVIQVATGQSMAPFCYLDADGNLVGYDIDVLLDENVTIRSSSAVVSNITKVEIITRRSAFEKLKKALDAIGVSGMTVSEVMGCGMQKGAAEYYRGVPMESFLLEKIRIEIVISKVPVDLVVNTARRALYTGHIGDGKIFVYDVRDALKVRTGETGFAALQAVDDIEDVG